MRTRTRMMAWRMQFPALLAGLMMLMATAKGAEMVTLFDFTKGAPGWAAAHAVANLQATAEGLAFDCTGEDPYVEGPPVANMPQPPNGATGGRLFVTLRMKSTADAGGEIFYANPGWGADHSAQFMIEADGQWHDYTVQLPSLKPGDRLRLDPGNGTGHVVVQSIKAEAVAPLTDLKFAKPEPVRLAANPDMTIKVEHGGESLELQHGGQWGQFVVRVNGQEMAANAGHDQLGLMLDGKPVALELDRPGFGDSPATFGPIRKADGAVVAPQVKGLMTQLEFSDPAGGKWHLTRNFRPAPEHGAIRVETEIRCDQDREVFHMPILTLFPGLGTYGERKTQAVLPGVEYLEDEPSSSEADFNAKQADRRVVDDYRICFPLMALVHEGRYLGVVWNRQDHPAVIFDSPDRTYKSGAHLMGLWWPGVGEQRLEGDLVPYKAVTIKANQPLVMSYTLIGGAGTTVNDPVKAYVAMQGGLPETPVFKGELPAAANLLAHGWLDSANHGDGTWGHAVWSGYTPGPASDAPAHMLWLAGHTTDTALADRLSAEAKRGLEQLPKGDLFGPTVSHVTRPLPPLLFGATTDTLIYLDRRAAQALDMLKAFDEKGILHYHPQPGKPNYARTHYADHTAGFAACALETIMEAASLSSNPDLTQQALAVLDKQTALYANSVPRGAQTWEMPLHTPDILGSARLVRCYVLGYQLTGDPKYLEQARYWAWTGVSMVYLDPPVAKPVGLYATIGVIGATGWVAPNWMGQPVQWCGLVYRSALDDLARVDDRDRATWEKLARGITVTGLQFSWPLTDARRQGLLPDFYHLKAQVSDGPAINPGTVGFGLPDAYGEGRLYDCARLTAGGALAHAPGAIGYILEGSGAAGRSVTFVVKAWPKEPYRILVTHLATEPLSELKVEWRGESAYSASQPLETQYDPAHKTLMLRVQGPGVVVLHGVK